MPFYDLVCSDCKKEFEEFLKYDDVDNQLYVLRIVQCPRCKSNKIKRIIKNSIPVIYKGDGFTKKKDK